jgi:hypothetical protein
VHPTPAIAGDGHDFPLRVLAPRLVRCMSKSMGFFCIMACSPLPLALGASWGRAVPARAPFP